MRPVPARPGPFGVAAAAVTSTGYVVLLLASLGGHAIAFTAGVVVAAAGEAWLRRAAPAVAWLMDESTLTRPWRWAAMSLCLVLLEGRAGAASVVGTATVVGTVVVAAAAALLEGLATLTEHWRKSPVLSRNLPIQGLQVARAPRLLLRWRGRLAWPAQLLLVVGGALSLAAGAPGAVRTSAWVACILAAVALGYGATATMRARAEHVRVRVPAAVQQAVGAWAPEVVLYFGGRATARYQVEMWLATFEASGRRTLVLLRDREAWRELRPTTLPVLCIPASTVLTAFDLRTVRAALFVANGATNIHLLRMGGMRTAFIGHGDSDKASSRNPFVKVYDEVWVAGAAGAARYARADTTSVEERIRVVGLPQARPRARTERDPASPFTVLYAPTWEGWGVEPYHSSLPHDGVAIVRGLLATAGVRVVYRPHPLTGTRDGAVRRAHHQVLSLLRDAGAPRDTPAPPGPWQGDDVDRMLLGAAGAARTTVEDPAEDFWRRHGQHTHRVAEGPLPGLQSCMEHADLLVADISGAVSDWLVQDRPLALTNPAGLTPEDYVARYPSGAAGRVLGKGGAGLTELVADLRGGLDPTAADRAVARAVLVGAPDQHAFEAALDDITDSRSSEAAAGEL